MKAILVPVGSMGDVHPFIGIGQELKQRGHQVTILTNRYFEESIESCGLNFAETSSRASYLEHLNNKDLWDPDKAFPFIAREIMGPMTRTIYHYIENHYVKDETFVVASTLGLGARIAQEKLGVPTISAHLQPSVLRSLHDTSIYHPKMKFVCHSPNWFKKIVFSLSDKFIDKHLAPGLNQFRSELDLPGVTRIFGDWIHSPLCVLGLFPDWYAPMQPDWPKQTHLTGFPLFDLGTSHSLNASIETFLAKGDPPIVFTAGSAMTHAHDFFRASVEACDNLGLRCILMTKFKDQLPQPLSSNALHIEYAPFETIFSRAKAVVHHGGIGTTAQALRAGIPQIIMPMAHDQPDNAHRVTKLGVGLSITPSKYTSRNVMELLNKISHPSFKQKTAVVRSRFEGASALKTACDRIEACIIK